METDETDPSEIDFVYTRRVRRLLDGSACLFGLIVGAGVTANLGLEDWSPASVAVGAGVWMATWLAARALALAWLTRL